MTGEAKKSPGLKVAVIGSGRSAFETALALAGATSAPKLNLDQVSIAPTMQGSAGRAWEIDLASVAAGKGRGAAGAHGGVASWLIEAPYAHPGWHSYFLMLIHLRAIPGMEPPTINLPGATHEFFLFALNPDFPREPAILRHEPRWLTPSNFGAQLVAASDAAAVERLHAAVDDVINGRLNPDTDHRSAWIARFGDSMIKPEFR